MKHQLPTPLAFFSLCLIGAAAWGAPATAPSTGPAPAQPGLAQPAPEPAPPRPAIGIVDMPRAVTALGWKAEQEKDRAAARAEMERQLKTFRESLTGVVDSRRKQIIQAAKLNPDEAERLARGEIDRVALSREQREELVQVITRANEAAKMSMQAANNAMQQREAASGQMMLEAMRPALRRAAMARDVHAVFQANQLLYFDATVDLTDIVIDELQKAPPKLAFPPPPQLLLPEMKSLDIASPAAAPATKP